MTAAITEAREYEAFHSTMISPEERPAFHLSPLTGWMNDPNGFSRYKGEYHMFYQYYPYEAYWGPMHWGHAVSKDLLHWEYKPAALAPDMPYDLDGCFSGSAVELPDGRQMLIYTGVLKKQTIKGETIEIQTQNLAFGDGTDYVKFGGNPVIDAGALPQNGSRAHFRDPKIIRCADGSYRCYSVNWMEGSGGTILEHRSLDGIHWSLKGVLARNDFRLGRMWECPDLFALDGKDILMASLMDACADGLEYDSGDSSFWVIGKYDAAAGSFEWEQDFCVDHGIDFYAPQTILAEDGRRIMIAWMQNWDTVKLRSEEKMKWYGQLTVPRELEIHNGRIYQNPIRELEALRGTCTEVQDVNIENANISIDGIRGRVLDLTVDVEAADREDVYREFRIEFAKNDRFRTELIFRPEENTITVNRRYSGTRRAMVHDRTAAIDGNGGRIRLRLILDRFSAEIFINDGEKAMTLTLETPQDADGIAFAAKGAVRVRAVSYELN